MIILNLVIIALFTYPWPMRPFDSAHGVSGTLGDARGTQTSPRFHWGIDIPAGAGTDVFSIISGTASTLGERVRVGDYWYIHLDDPIPDGQEVLGILDTINTPPTFIGDVAVNHLHFQIGSPGPPEGPFHNPLSYGGGPVGYDDTLKPTISSVTFWRQGSEGATAQQLDSILDGELDIRACCQDVQTSGGMNNTSGIHKLEWLVTDTTGSDTLTIAQTITFPQVQPPNNGDSVLLVYDRHNYTTYSPFYYWATNRIVSNQVEDRYWNTKQKADSAGIPFPDSVDADSIEVAKFKDGYYWLKVYAYDIRNNADSESVYVHVDNFNPRVKIAYPTDHYHHIEKYEKEVWCTFSEAMDTATLIPANITIRSLVDTSHHYSIVNITYIDSLFKLVLEVDSFFFHDEVEVQLSDSITDLAGKSIEQEGNKEESIAYSWKFTVGVIKLTDNDIMDIRPDIYGDKIAWVEVLSSTNSNLKLHDLTSHNTLTLNTTTDGFHNWPIVWKGQVAWREEVSAGDRIFYWDGNSTQLIVAEGLFRNQYDFDSCGIVMYSTVRWDGGYPDTIWVQYYEIGTGLSLLDRYTVKDDFSRNVDIDGSEIVWEHGETSDDGRGLGVNGSPYSSIVYERGYKNARKEIWLLKDKDWEDRATYTKDIYLRSWFGQMNLTSSLDSSINAMPSVSQGQSAWMRYTWNKDTLAIAVWVYDGVGGRQLSVLPYINYGIYWPEIQNGDVMWHDYYSGTGLQRLHYYDGWQDNILASGFSTDDFIFWNWQVENNQAVWLQLGAVYYPVYYDGQQITKLLERNSDSYRIGVHQGLVVYDAWDGHDNEIYLYIGDTLKTPPAVAKNLRNEILETDSDDKQASKEILKAESDERSAARVNLIWSPNSEPDLAGYNVYRSDSAYTYGTIPYSTVGATDTIFLDTLPLTGRNYYVVTAFDDLNNESGLSNQTLADLTPDTIPPSAPTNLVAACDSPYQVVDLTWDASPEPDVGLYRIYRADSSGGYSTPLDSVAESVTAYADSTIVQGMTYYYVVTAVDTIDTCISNRNMVYWFHETTWNPNGA